MAQLKRNPAAGTDDGYWFVSSAGYGNSDTSIGFGTGYSYWFRAPNITVPKNATIDSATFDFHCPSKTGGITSQTTDIFCNNVDNAVYPVDRAAGLALALTSGISRTITYPTVPATIAINDIGAPIQSIINRSGWVSGNALMLIFTITAGNGGFGNFYTYDNGTNLWALTINYTVASVSNTISIKNKGLYNRKPRLDYGF